ncbi:MAG: hypothetical protein SVV80_10960, partial [Planctomycetota bacterium]|nr:hypothetical protein [Planctomycetota bacterium]
MVTAIAFTLKRNCRKCLLCSTYQPVVKVILAASGSFTRYTASQKLDESPGFTRVFAPCARAKSRALAGEAISPRTASTLSH